MTKFIKKGTIKLKYYKNNKNLSNYEIMLINSKEGMKIIKKVSKEEIKAQIEKHQKLKREHEERQRKWRMYEGEEIQVESIEIMEESIN